MNIEDVQGIYNYLVELIEQKGFVGRLRVVSSVDGKSGKTSEILIVIGGGSDHE
jgi:hypothetical protein